MAGDRELAQLAQLIRLGADTARRIASMRSLDGADVRALADRAETIAEDLDFLVEKSRRLESISTH